MRIKGKLSAGVLEEVSSVFKTGTKKKEVISFSASGHLYMRAMICDAVAAYHAHWELRMASKILEKNLAEEMI